MFTERAAVETSQSTSRAAGLAEAWPRVQEPRQQESITVATTRPEASSLGPGFSMTLETPLKHN